MAPTNKSKPTAHEGRRQVASTDGELSFVMTRTARGVHVERVHRFGVRRVAHAALFTTPHEFERFFDRDQLRFDYPLVYQQIKRAFDDLIVPDS